MTEIIRNTTPTDLESMDDLYNPLITDSHVSFSVEPWTIALREKWWYESPADLPALVAEVDGTVVGLTYESRYRPRPAYESSVETTIVLDPSAQGRGRGTRLLGTILEVLG